MSDGLGWTEGVQVADKAKGACGEARSGVWAGSLSTQAWAVRERGEGFWAGVIAVSISSHEHLNVV